MAIPEQQFSTGTGDRGHTNLIALFWPLFAFLCLFAAIPDFVFPLRLFVLA